ncbi:MAG: DUF523 domain-containing protein [Deltaproteobacteria bacterium]|nr:DUF523 domain-containing protein [Deltaproteobacteria bacterium]
MAERIVASACLCGVQCRYDGRGGMHPHLMELLARGLVIPVCPEVLGGLPVPRDPCEIRGAAVVDKGGVDRTAAFARGAAAALGIARECGVTTAVLKERSPSCGVRFIYDGTFASRLVPGRGLTARLLAENGIVVISDEAFSL